MKKVIYLLTILFVFTFANVSEASVCPKCPKCFPVTNYSHAVIAKNISILKVVMFSRKKKGGGTILSKRKHTIGKGQSSNDLSKVKGPKKINVDLAYKKSPKINQNLAVFHK